MASLQERYPLVNVNKKRWKITMFNGKTHYFDWAMFNSYVTKYQRVNKLIFLKSDEFVVLSFRGSTIGHT